MGKGLMELHGYEDIMDALGKLGAFAHYANPLLRRAANAGAEIVRDEAARLAPRSHMNHVHLADNIVTRNAVIKKTGEVLAKVGVRKGFWHANPVEGGHIVRSRSGYRLVPAQPFMSVAFITKHREAQDRMAEVLREGLPAVLDQVAKKQNGGGRK